MVVRLIVQTLAWCAFLGVLLFWPAGTLHWREAWIFLAAMAASASASEYGSPGRIRPCSPNAWLPLSSAARRPGIGCSWPLSWSPAGSFVLMVLDTGCLSLVDGAGSSPSGRRFMLRVMYLCCRVDLSREQRRGAGRQDPARARPACDLDWTVLLCAPPDVCRLAPVPRRRHAALGLMVGLGGRVNDLALN